MHILVKLVQVLFGLCLLGFQTFPATETHAAAIKTSNNIGGMSCGPSPGPLSKILLPQNDTVVPYGQFPWQAGIFYKMDGSFLCSGTLISARHILTSAFCMLTISGDANIVIRLGAWDLKDKGSSASLRPYLTTSVIQTTLYPESSVLDTYQVMPVIALLRLKESVDFHRYPQIAPICLPEQIDEKMTKSTKRDRDTKECFVSGWGFQAPESLKIPDDQQPEVKINHREARNADEGPFMKLRYEYSVESMAKVGADGSRSVSRVKHSAEPDTFSLPLFSTNYQKSLYESYLRMENSPVFNAPPLQPPQQWPINTQNEFTPKTVYKVAEAPPQVRKTKNPDPIDEYSDYQVENNRRRPSPELQKAQHDRLLYEPRFDSEYFADDIYDNSTDIVPKRSHLPKEIQDQIEVMEKDMRRQKEKYSLGKKRAALMKNPPTYANPPPIINLPFAWDSGKIKRSTDEAPGSEIEAEIDNYNKIQTPMPTKTLLKLVEVEIQENCKALPVPVDPNTDSPIGRSCVVPRNTNTPTTLCIADMGSPITCIGKSNSASNTKKTRNGQGKSYLAGIVTWKRPCLENDLDPMVNITLITNTYDFLTFIQNNLKD